MKRNGLMVLILVIVLLVSTVRMVGAQDDGLSAPDSDLVLTGVWGVALGLALTVNRVLAVVKPYLREWVKGDREYTALLQALSVLAGVGLAAWNQLNLLEQYGRVPMWFGFVVTGAVIGWGSEGLHLLYRLMQWFKPVGVVEKAVG